MRVVWTVPAVRDVWRAHAYLLEFNPRAAQRIAEALFDAGDSLEEFPYRGRPVRGTAMRELLSVDPYVIRYAVVGDDVVILRVRHGARRPTNP